MARGAQAGSAEATQEPTARRLADARRAGQVAHSADLRGAIALGATGAALAVLGPSIVGQLIATFAAGLRRAPAREPLATAAARAFDSGARVLAVPLAVVLTCTLAAGLIQTGGLWTGVARVDLGRLWPGWAGGRGRSGGAPSLSSALAVAAGLAKAALVGLVAAGTLGALMPGLVGLAGASGGRSLAAFGAAARVLGGRLLLVLLLLGAIDYVWVRGRHRRALRMTRREIEHERREQEGDALLRAERGRLRRELSESAGAMTSIAHADLVVTGGGAERSVVALAYQRGGARAPVVVAVGRGASVASLLAAARASGVAVAHDPDLLAVLQRLDPGAEIPPPTYQRVAEHLRAADIDVENDVDVRAGRRADAHGTSRQDA